MEPITITVSCVIIGLAFVAGIYFEKNEQSKKKTYKALAKKYKAPKKRL